jgi:GAF domain-containing protein
MERLREISRTLVSTLDSPRLLYRIMLAAGELTDTEVASIMLFDPQSIMPAPIAGLRVLGLSHLLPGP